MVPPHVLQRPRNFVLHETLFILNSTAWENVREAKKHHIKWKPRHWATENSRISCDTCHPCGPGMNMPALSAVSLRGAIVITLKLNITQLHILFSSKALPKVFSLFKYSSNSIISYLGLNGQTLQCFVSPHPTSLSPGFYLSSNYRSKLFSKHRNKSPIPLLSVSYFMQRDISCKATIITLTSHSQHYVLTFGPESYYLELKSSPG